MQYAKDSFYAAMRDRLSRLNPQRQVTIDGNPRPSIVVVENERPESTGQLVDVFCLNWSAQRAMAGAGGQTRLHRLDCVITYRVAGSDESDNIDRGRGLTAMDTELLRIAEPPSAPKCDYTQTPVRPLGTNICWSGPVFGGVKVDGKRLERSASFAVFCFTEAA